MYFILFITITITLYLLTQSNNKTDQLIFIATIIGQTLFLVGIYIDNINIREKAHMIFTFVTTYGSLFGRQLATRLYMFMSNITVWTSHVILGKCAFRLYDKVSDPPEAFPPKWIHINIREVFWAILTFISAYRLFYANSMRS